MKSLPQGPDEEDQEIAWEASGKNTMSNLELKIKKKIETLQGTLVYHIFFRKKYLT
jgi:hypothetical protein